MLQCNHCFVHNVLLRSGGESIRAGLCCRPKSSTAAKAAKAINSAFSPVALQNRVSPETEEVFDDAFWESQDVVINALDNVAARLYVDARCVYFSKPLLESGTLGAKCNTQCVIPSLTENYGRYSQQCTHHCCLASPMDAQVGALSKSSQKLKELHCTSPNY